jgi:hypothetical protein
MTSSHWIHLLIRIRSHHTNRLTILQLGDQAHQLYMLILDMSNIDPESLQFENDPCTWEEAWSSADSKHWENGYHEELQSLKDMNVYKLVPWTEVPQGCHIHKG